MYIRDLDVCLWLVNAFSNSWVTGAVKVSMCISPNSSPHINRATLFGSCKIVSVQFIVYFLTKFTANQMKLLW